MLTHASLVQSTNEQSLTEIWHLLSTSDYSQPFFAPQIFQQIYINLKSVS